MKLLLLVFSTALVAGMFISSRQLSLSPPFYISTLCLSLLFPSLKTDIALSSPGFIPNVRLQNVHQRCRGHRCLPVAVHADLCKHVRRRCRSAVRQYRSWNHFRRGRNRATQEHHHPDGGVKQVKIVKRATNQHVRKPEKKKNTQKALEMAR